MEGTTEIMTDNEATDLDWLIVDFLTEQIFNTQTENDESPINSSGNSKSN